MRQNIIAFISVIAVVLLDFLILKFIDYEQFVIACDLIIGGLIYEVYYYKNKYNDLKKELRNNG